jgi:Amt family ammonium transporter
MGTIAIGLWAEPTLTTFGAHTGKAGILIAGGSADILITQIIGSASTVVWVTVTTVIMFAVLAAVKRLRVNAKADAVGIDVYEHGATAYPDILPFPGDSPVEMGGARSAAPAGD